MVVIVDYGLGNPRSVYRMVSAATQSAQVSSSPHDIEKADHLILPGVGSFDAGMSKLGSLSLLSPLREAVIERRIPILGICLGAQLLGTSSEEGNSAGLGWIPAVSRKLILRKPLKVPHIGWNVVHEKVENPLFNELSPHPRFFFAHSYFLQCDHVEATIAVTRYGIEFAAAISYKNIFGVQFHPEKSYRTGFQLLSNFLRISI